MIQAFVDRYNQNIEQIRAAFAANHPADYTAIVRAVVDAIKGDGGYEEPNPDRIHVIDDGDYQGTLLFVIAGDSYQPSTYWAVAVDYGSCSGCDTLEAIRGYDDEQPTEEQVAEYMTLALHVVQGIRQIAGYGL